MEEYLDVLDTQGNFIGQKKLRSEVHRDEDWHRLAFVWIMNSHGELLMQKRSMTKDANPGRWDVSCGGHVAAGETSLATAVKELSEELGITASGHSLKHLFFVKEEDENSAEKQFSDGYLLQSDMLPSQFKLQKEEIDEVRYVPWREVEKLMMKNDGSFAPRRSQYEKFFRLLRARKIH
jgi:isopentenyl-diphosphate delta-isomerase type 1